MSRYAKAISPLTVPQTEPVPGMPMVANSGGGFGFEIDPMKQLTRFLVLGAAGGTYYASERKLTIENAKIVEDCLAFEANLTIELICVVSETGRAPKNDPAIFALALASRKHIEDLIDRNAINRVCRTGTHLYQFAQTVKSFRGDGAGLKKLISGWFDAKTPDEIAFQFTKYGSRDGWSGRDILRNFHVKPSSPGHDTLFRWIVKGKDSLGDRVVDRSKGKGANSSYSAVNAELLPHICFIKDKLGSPEITKTEIQTYLWNCLPREFLEGAHSKLLNDPDIWAAMLPKMPLNAMIRNLGKMTSIGLIKPLSAASKLVCDKLGNAEWLKGSKVHPYSIFLAHCVYRRGEGVKGSLKWVVDPTVSNALEAAFFKAFASVIPAGKRTYIGLDVSGSMTSAFMDGITTCREAGAALTLVLAKTEPQCVVRAFSATMMPLDFGRFTSMQEALRVTNSLPFAWTDCSIPMRDALANKLEVDTFVIITDSETNANTIHPFVALQDYRKKTGIPARLVVIAMTSTGFSIADPSDAGMLDMVGFDASGPAILADFSAGRI